jgi:ribose/xylose/arabinose/galactoside ABC-type transport system permease subunit
VILTSNDLPDVFEMCDRVLVIGDHRQIHNLTSKMTPADLVAHFAGIKVIRIRLIAFANPKQGAGLMLDAIAAVFLGMTMTRQGEPRVLYTLIGVLMLGIIDNGPAQLKVDSFIREILVGLIVITAVAIAQISKQQGR